MLRVAYPAIEPTSCRLTEGLLSVPPKPLLQTAAPALCHPLDENGQIQDPKKLTGKGKPLDQPE